MADGKKGPSKLLLIKREEEIRLIFIEVPSTVEGGLITTWFSLDPSIVPRGNIICPQGGRSI